MPHDERPHIRLCLPHTDPEAVRRVQMQLLLQLLRRSGAQPVEDVVVSLILALHANPGLLQQVVGDEPAYDCVLRTCRAWRSTTRAITRQKHFICQQALPSR